MKAKEAAGIHTPGKKGEGDLFGGQRVQNGWSVHVMRSEEHRSWRSGLVGLVCCVYHEVS